MNNESRTEIENQFYNRNLSKPNEIALDASSMCQLKCPLCPTSKGENKKGIIGWGYLKFNDFKTVIEKNPNIKIIELSNWGEIFLNPEIKQIIKFAYDNNVELKGVNGSNLNNADDEILEYLVKYKFKKLSISLDGASEETYQIYRKGGNFNKVIENIKKINHFKNKYNSKFPEIIWQFVIFGHNEHELRIARKMAEDLNMIFSPKLNWDSSYSPVKEKELVKKETKLRASSKEEFKEKHKIPYIIPCFQLWNAPQINWDGKLLGCCVNKWLDFGNAFESSLEICLKNEKYEYAKKMILGLEKAREDIPCSKCSQYIKNVLITPITEKQIFIDYCMRLFKNKD